IWMLYARSGEGCVSGRGPYLLRSSGVFDPVSWSRIAQAVWRVATELDAVAMERKIFAPSAEPSRLSLQRSGCGIIPRTLRPGLQIPAMLSSDPLGLAAEVI